MHGLVALMELQSSRLRAETATGEPVLLADQDRSRWDQLLVHRGLLALERSANLARSCGPLWVAGGHSFVPRPGQGVGGDRLGEDRRPLRCTGPGGGLSIVDLNRAVAVSMAYGPEAALEIVDALSSDPVLDGFKSLLEFDETTLTGTSKNTK